MINLFLNNKKLAMIDNSGKINHLKDYDKGTWFFAGLSSSKQGDYAYSLREMLSSQLRITPGQSYYPILCDNKGNYTVVKHKITSIEYIEGESENDNVA